MAIATNDRDRAVGAIIHRDKDNNQTAGRLFHRATWSPPGQPPGQPWDKDRIDRLSSVEIVSLRANALKRGEAAIVAQCNEAMTNRRAPPNATKTIARTVADRLSEKEVAPLLETFATEMLTIFDLNEDRATALSRGTNGFIPHRLVSKSGRAKIGGAQKSGLVAFDRYISYRLKNETYEFSVRKPLGSNTLVYEIAAPKKYLPDPQPISALRPRIPEVVTNDSNRFGQHFADFLTAASLYRGILAQVAPGLA